MQDFVDKVISPDEAESVLSYAKKGTAVPEGLQGIFWMDQHAFSTVGKDPEYPYAFKLLASAEVLASFGPDLSDYDPASRCLTPVPSYGGLEWACRSSPSGRFQMDNFLQQRMAMSFCYIGEGFDTVQVYQKMMLPSAAFGPFNFGLAAARLLGLADAGDGYVWMSLSIVNMTMEKTPWGWDRVTTFFGHNTRQNALTRWAQWQILPAPLREMLEWAAEEHADRIFHYPLIQIVDGEGNRTKYYHEYLACMKDPARSAKGDGLLLRVPAP